MPQPRRQKRILNVLPSRDTGRDWRIENADAAGLLGARRQVRVPKTVDLRADWWSVGDQGATGSCVGWATADSLLRWHATAARLKINSYFNLSPGRGGSLERWREWLATNGPILTRLDVDRTWFDAKATKGNLDEYREETAEGGHAVAIVGYTADRFIVRNSWGTTGWGDKGFGYASLAYAQQAFTEAYGVDA